MLIKRTTLNITGATNQELNDEYQKCKQDIEYFINKYIIVERSNSEPCSSTFYPYQLDTINQYSKHKFVIQVAAPQTGNTHTLIAYAIWYMLFNPNQKILYATESKSESINCCRIAKIMVDNLPSWITRSLTVRCTMSTVAMCNNSSISFSKMTNDIGHGMALSLVILDGFSKVDNELQRCLYLTLLPVIISAGGSMILSSILPKNHNMFTEILQQALLKQNQFHTIVWPWTIVPRREDYSTILQSVLSNEQWRREYLCELIT